MKPLFTIHAGEYLVGSYMEKHFKGYNLWVPSKDMGVDFLVSDAKNRRAVSLQVKFSKDYSSTNVKDIFLNRVKSRGWFSLNRNKIKQSSADYWIFVLYGFDLKQQRNIQYVIIDPKELLKRLTKLHGKIKTIHSYLSVTSKNKCWETRGLRKKQQMLIANNEYIGKDRDFSKYLNNWGLIIRKL